MRARIPNVMVGAAALALCAPPVILHERVRQAESPMLSALLQGMRPDDSGYLLWVFQPADCGESQAVVEVLNQAYSGGKSVRGVIGSDEPGVVPRVRTLYDVGVPLVIISPAKLALLVHHLGYQATPLAITVDRSGRLREVAPGPQAVALALRWTGISLAAAPLL